MSDFLSLTFEDSYGRRTRKLVEMEHQALHADQVAVAVAFSTAIEAVTDLGLVRADIIYQAVDEGFDPTAGSNIDVGATFSGVLYDANGEKASFKIPGIKAALVDPDGSVPLTGAVGTALAFFVNATPYDLFLSDGETIDHWLAGSLDK